MLNINAFSAIGIHYIKLKQFLLGCFWRMNRAEAEELIRRAEI